MDTLQFYKEFYVRELSRKNELDNAVNMPVFTISTLISLNIYFVNKIPDGNLYNILIVLVILNFIALIVCFGFLAKSFFNFGLTNKYAEIDGMDKYYNYQRALQKENNDSDFRLHLERELAVCAGENFNKNKMRTENLASAKRWLFAMIILTFLSTIDYLVSITQ